MATHLTPYTHNDHPACDDLTVTRMKWARKLPPRRTRLLMRVAMVLWVVTIIGGFVLYLVAFVM